MRLLRRRLYGDGARARRRDRQGDVADRPRRDKRSSLHQRALWLAIRWFEETGEIVATRLTNVAVAVGQKNVAGRRSSSTAAVLLQGRLRSTVKVDCYII